MWANIVVWPLWEEIPLRAMRMDPAPHLGQVPFLIGAPYPSRRASAPHRGLAGPGRAYLGRFEVPRPGPHKVSAEVTVPCATEENARLCLRVAPAGRARPVD
jgi:hypothetical protein